MLQDPTLSQPAVSPVKPGTHWASAPEGERVDHADFARRAEAILSAIDEYRSGLGLTDALLLVHERFVDDETHESLRDFSELMAQARRLSLVQEQLDADRDRLHHGHLNHSERMEVGHHYEMLRHEACNYNHKLRNFIETHREQISRHNLTSWLASAAQGRYEWVVGEVTGAMSEIALHAALMGLPELRDLRYATVEEDLHGYDFIASWQGKLLTVDAKTGSYYPLSERKHGHRHLEISVPRDMVDGFALTRRGLDLLRRETRRALHGEAVHHVPHGYWRSQDR